MGGKALLEKAKAIEDEWRGWVVSPLVAAPSSTPGRKTTAWNFDVRGKGWKIDDEKTLRTGRTELALFSVPTSVGFANQVFTFNGSGRDDQRADEKIDEASCATLRTIGGTLSFETGSHAKRKIVKARRGEKKKTTTTTEAATQTRWYSPWRVEWVGVARKYEELCWERSSRAKTIVMGVAAHLSKERRAAAMKIEPTARKKREAKASRKLKWMKMKGWWVATGEAAWLWARRWALVWTLGMGRRRLDDRRSRLLKKNTKDKELQLKQREQASSYKEFCGSLGAECPYNPVLIEQFNTMMNEISATTPTMRKRTTKRETEIEEKEGGRFWWLP